MHILFLSHYYAPEVNAPASRTADHCSRWVAAGHRVEVVTCVPNVPDGVPFPGYRSRLAPQTERIDGVDVTRIWTYLAPNAGSVRRIANYLSYMVSALWHALGRSRPDIVVATSPQFFCGWAGVWMSRMMRRPFVLEVRDIWPESISAVGAIRSPGVLRFLEGLERRMYEAADHIVAVGEGYADRVVHRAPDTAGRIRVVMNGVDLGRFPGGRRQLDAPFRREWGVGKAFVCSYVGTVGMAHGLDVVLDAAASLRQAGREDIRFVIVGDGARRAALQERCAREGLDDLVHFAGRLPKASMPGVLEASDACLVHLRGVELFGTVIPSKIFESMAMERPIIMGVRGQARDIVLGAGAGVAMEPESAGDLAAAVVSLADDPELRARMGRAGRDLVEREFDRDVLAGEMLAHLGRWVEEAGAARGKQPTR